MKKLLVIALSLVLALGVFVFGASAAEEVVLDISTLTENKADANGVWEYEDCMLTVNDDVVLTGTNENLTVCVLNGATVTLRDAYIKTETYCCHCGDKDTFCNSGAGADPYTIIVEGQNYIENDFYFNYGSNLTLEGDGVLELIDTDPSAHDIVFYNVTIEGPTITTEDNISMTDCEIFSGKLMAHEILITTDCYFDIYGGEIIADFLRGPHVELTILGGELDIYIIDLYATYDSFEDKLLTSNCYITNGVVKVDEYIGVSGALEITGGAIKARYIVAHEGLAINDGNITAEYIYSRYNTLINGGELILDGYENPYDSSDINIALACEGTLTINGGCIKAKAVNIPEDIQEDIGYPEKVSIAAVNIVIGDDAEIIEGEGPTSLEEIDVQYIGGNAHICALENNEDPEEDSSEEDERLENPATSDMNVVFFIALLCVSAVTAIGIKKIKTM